MTKLNTARALPGTTRTAQVSSAPSVPSVPADRIATPEETERIIQVRKCGDELVEFLEASLEEEGFREAEQLAIVYRIGEWVGQRTAAVLAQEKAKHNTREDNGEQKPSAAQAHERTRPPEQKLAREARSDVADTLDQCERIIQMAEDSDIPDEGRGFCEDVAEKVRSVSETIERTGRVTARQQEALDNWESGVGRWAARGEW
jgi:hypothetical protein